MSNRIFEELPARKHAVAAAAPASKGNGKEKGGTEQSSDKRIRQAVYDIRYRARREDVDLRQAFAQYMQHSSLNQAEKTAVRGKLFGKEGGAMKEEYALQSSDWASTSVAKAMFKVFVEGVSTEVSELDYLEELKGLDDRKYKVRVTDKKTGKSYVRYATREKITQLRANPNIQSVEMTEYGEPYEGEKSKGEKTAKAKSGKGLDPVGKEDTDVDNDGKHNDPNDKYIMKRRKAIGDAIKKREGVSEEFLVDGTESTEGQNRKKITGKSVDNYSSGVVKVSPEDTTQSSMRGPKNVYAHTELEGEVILEKAKSKAQQRFMGMVYAAKKGEKPASPEVAAAAKSITKKEAKKFAKTKHKGIPEKVEEAACSSDDEKNDNRGEYTKINLIKNKLRAMGAKNPVVMAASYEPNGNTISEREFDEPGEEDWRPDVRAHNKAAGYRGGYRPYKKTYRGPKPGDSTPGSQAKPAD